MVKVAITGSSGLLGQHLIKFLLKNDYEIVTIGRSKNCDVTWNPDTGEIDERLLENIDVMIHLAGENIANKRWSDRQKKYLMSNRRKCAEIVSSLCKKHKIKKVLVASAVGYYGHRLDEKCTESQAKGKGFASDLCYEIENFFDGDLQECSNVCFMRFGVILSQKGGALVKMALPFKLFLGGLVGDGNQKISWVDIDDATSAILYLLKNENISGPVNITSPNPVDQKLFAEGLGHVLRKPSWLPLPAFMVRFLLGEMGQALLLDSLEVYPEKLLKNGFNFMCPNLQSSLKNQYK